MLPSKAAHVLAASRSPAVLTGLTACATNQAGVGGMELLVCLPCPCCREKRACVGSGCSGKCHVMEAPVSRAPMPACAIAATDSRSPRCGIFGG